MISQRLILFFALLAYASGAFGEPRVRRNVELEFETIDGASLYEVQIVRKNDKKAQRFKLSTPQWAANIKPGLYVMQVRSYDDRGAPGEWSPPTDLKVRLPAIIVNSPANAALIRATSINEHSVSFTWEEIPGATRYKIWIKSSDGKITEEKTTSSPDVTIDLPVAHQYLWNAYAIDDNGDDGEASSEPYNLELRGPPLEKPSIDRPYSKYVQELSWSQPSRAESYNYDLSRWSSKSKSWERVESLQNLKQNNVVLDIRQPSGKYRVTVVAQAPARDDSPAAKLDFFMEGGFKNQADFDKAVLRDGITRPTKYYAIGSYLFTTMQYVGVYHETNSAPSFEATGGTGRVGIGYQPPKSKWGGFAIADLSGFVISGKNYRFASAEGHVTRKLELGQGGILQFGAGLFLKELPVIEGNETTGLTGVGNIKNIGPHAGFTFWQPLKSRFGLQLNARGYLTGYGLTSHDQTVLPSFSYQLGLLGSYRLDKNTMGYAGYAIRKDQGKFEASPDASNFANSGDIDSVSVEGNYINLILEFSF